ncbi:MAG: site-2 protease family protein [Elainellaceae cyanobacterium]
MITALLLLTALLILGWGLYRARPYSPASILAWLQSAVLFVPWLILLALPFVGLFPSLAVILLLIVMSIGLYIFLGSRLRLMTERSPAQAQPPQPNHQTEPQVPFTPSVEGRDSPTELAAIPPQGTDDIPGESKSTSKTAQLDIAPMPEEDLAQIRPIFGIDTFFATELVPYQGGAVVKGNLRGENAAETHQVLSQRLSDRVGDRYRLFLLTGPEDKPVVIILPSSRDPQQSSAPQWGFALLLLAATIATSLEAAGILQGFDFFNTPDRFSESWPIAMAIVTILLAHEAGHWLWAKRYDVRLSPPFLIPAWQIGSFGALTRFESILPNRTVLFDISFAGPAAGGVVSLGFLIAGLSLSHQGSMFQVPSQFFQGSVLVGSLARVFMGSALQAPLVDVHPLAIIGWLGLVITAINVMPAGQLDGGRIVQAIYGRKIARITTIATLIVLAIATLANPLALYWAIVILFLQRDLERPSLEELTEPNDIRAALGLFILFFTAAILLPLTPSLAGRLGIGG